MKRILPILALVWMAVVIRPVRAQDEELNLRLTRDWGYGGFDGRIQGRFSLHASGPDNLVEVRFLIDGSVVHVARDAPFRYQFETGAYGPGPHRLTAIGVLSNGVEMQGSTFQRTFITAEEARQEIRGLLLPLLAVVVGFAVVFTLVPAVLGRGREHRPGQYGMAGGAVCPRCRLPYSRRLLAPNLFIGKLERCPHCGKWSLVGRASPAALQAAEARLAEEGELESSPESEAERLKRMIDESKYSN